MREIRQLPAAPADISWLHSFSQEHVLHALTAIYRQQTGNAEAPKDLEPILAEIARHHAFANEGKRDRATSAARRAFLIKRADKGEDDNLEPYQHETTTPLRAVMERISADHQAMAGSAEVIAQQKITAFADALTEHPFAPALTAHPTNPRSLEIEEALYRIQAFMRVMTNISNLQEQRTPAPPTTFYRKATNLYLTLHQLTHASHTASSGADTTESSSSRSTSPSDQEPLQDNLSNLSIEDLRQSLARLKNDAYRHLARAIESLEFVPVVAPQNLTVAQEVERNLRSYTSSMRTLPTITRQTILDFMRINAITLPYAKVKEQLMPAIAKQYQETAFWSASDADGNHNINASTMKDALKQHQLALIGVYRDRIAELIILAPQLAVQLETISYKLNQAETRIEEGQLFTKILSDELIGSIEQDIKEIQATLLNQTEHLVARTIDLQTRTGDLLDLFTTFGFVGPRMDVRQTTKTLDGVMQTILSFVQTKREHALINYITHPSAQTLQEVIQNTASKGQAVAFLNETLGNNDDAISDFIDDFLAPDSSIDTATRTELDRLIEIIQHPDVYQRYRVSDCRDVEDIAAIRVLESIAHRIVLRKQAQEQGIDAGYEADISDDASEAKSPLAYRSRIHVIALCETPDDVKRMPELSKKIANRGLYINDTIILFPGYSDLEKRGGLFGLITIAQGVDRAIKAIKESHPHIKVLISLGQGCDILRHGDKPVKDATIQGLPASQLTDPQIFKRWIRSASGHDDTYQQWLEELANLSEQGQALLTKLEEAACTNFRQMVSHEAGKNGNDTYALLQAATISEAVKGANRSSRAAAKQEAAAQGLASLGLPALPLSSPQKDPNPLDNIRAIGFSLNFSSTGTQAHILESFPSLDALSEEEIARLPELFKHSTIVQDIVYKGLYAAAITDYDRAWKTLTLNGVIEETPSSLDDLRDLAAAESNSPENTLAKAQLSAYEKLETIAAFLPANGILATRFSLRVRDGRSRNVPLNQIASGLLEDLSQGFSSGDPLIHNPESTEAMAQRAENLLQAAYHIQQTIHPRIRELLEALGTPEISKQERTGITNALTMAFKEEQHLPHAITHHTNDYARTEEIDRLQRESGAAR